MTLQLDKRYHGRILESTAAGIPIVATSPGGGGVASQLKRVVPISPMKRNWATKCVEVVNGAFVLTPDDDYVYIWVAYDWIGFDHIGQYSEVPIALYPNENVLGFLKDLLDLPFEPPTWRVTHPSCVSNIKHPLSVLLFPTLPPTSQSRFQIPTLPVNDS